MQLVSNLKRGLRSLEEQADEINGFCDAIIRRNDEMAFELDKRKKRNDEMMQMIRRCQEMIVRLVSPVKGAGPTVNQIHELRQEAMIYANILEGFLTNSPVAAYKEARAKDLKDIKLKYKTATKAITESGKVVPATKPKGKKK